MDGDRDCTSTVKQGGFEQFLIVFSTKMKRKQNIRGAFLTMIFLERLVLIGCNSFLLILVLKVGRNSWKLFHFVMMRCTTLYELHLKIFSLPARRLVPMFSEQQGKKEFWQSTSQPHPQELIKCLRACGIKKYILDACSFPLDWFKWFKGNHDSTEELSCVRWHENFYLP